MKMWYGLAIVPSLVLVSHSIQAEQTPKTVWDDLNNPCGVAVQPGTGHVFVSDSAAGRVIRIVKGKLEDVITGFPQDIYGKGPMYDIGPLGLAFPSQDTLVVGGGGLKDGDRCFSSGLSVRDSASSSFLIGDTWMTDRTILILS